MDCNEGDCPVPSLAPCFADNSQYPLKLTRFLIRPIMLQIFRSISVKTLRLNVYFLYFIRSQQKYVVGRIRTCAGRAQ